MVSVDDTYEDIEEIKVKGVSTQLLADYGIKEGSRIIMVADANRQGKSELYRNIQ